MDVQPVIDLARIVVTQVAPIELPLFEAMSRAYAADPSRAQARRGGDEALGFGLAEAVSLLTPMALVAADQVGRYLADDLSKSLTHMAGDAITKRIAKLFRREPDTPPLTQAQLSRIRDLVIEITGTGGVSAAQSRVLADALVGHLAVAARGAS